MGTDDIIFVQWCGTLLSQDICITLSYQGDTPEGGTNMPIEVLTAFLRDNTIDTIMGQLSSSFVTTEIKATNLSDEDEFTVLPVNIAGSVTGTAVMPPFVALGLKKDISTRTTRPGSIRIPGITEADVTGGVWDNFGASTIIAAALNNSLFLVDGPVSQTLVPVVVGRSPNGDFDLSRINQVTSFGNPRVTTQNSRKR